MFCVRITRMAAFSLLLASNSPRRRELLGWTGWQFTTAPADLDERPLPGESPLAHVERLAQGKAHKAGLTAPQDVLVVGADTIVVDDGNILGKPAHAADAARMLEQLRGRTHTVPEAERAARRARWRDALARTRTDNEPGPQGGPSSGGSGPVALA